MASGNVAIRLCYVHMHVNNLELATLRMAFFKIHY
jgi:hypothetical protein